jgi:phosphoribosylglycinamide formyltransferase-1
VTTELDHGPIIGQAVVPVLADDSAGALAERVLAQEHVLYPRAIRWMVEETLSCVDGVVRHLDGEPQAIGADRPGRVRRTRPPR